MDGLHQLVGGETTLRAGQREYRLSVRRARHYAEAEALLASRLPDPLEIAVQQSRHLEDATARHLLEVGFRQALRPKLVAAKDVIAWLGTAEGLSFALWQALRENDPTVTREQAYDVLDLVGVRAAREALDRAAGLPPPRPGVRSCESGNV